MPNSHSIFQLKKVDLEDLKSDQTSIESRVLTVNFESDGEIKNPEINAYFESRLEFMKLAYQFAKAAKLEENFDFTDDSKTREKMQAWLEEKGLEGKMITGTEFGVITTKVVESIKSIEENKYLKELAEGLKVETFKISNPEFDPKFKAKKGKDKRAEEKTNEELQDDLKNKFNDYKVSLDDLKKLSKEDFQKVFRYEEIAKAKVILELLDGVKDERVITGLIEKTQALMSGFIVAANEALSQSFDNIKEELDKDQVKSVSDLAKFYVQKVFFSFDGKIREIEAEYFPEINSNLNIIRQQFGVEFGAKDEFADLTEEQRQYIQKNCYYLWSFDWRVESSIQKWEVLLKKILDSAFDADIKIYKDDYGKTDNFFFKHPKSAPSFPSVKDKMISWQSTDRPSIRIKSSVDKWNDLKFWDYLLARSKRIIEQSDGYRVWQFIKESDDEDGGGEYEWIKWLNGSLNSSHDGEVEPENRFRNIRKDRFKVKDIDKVRIIEFKWDRDGKVNKRLPKIYSSKKNYRDGVDFVAEKVISTWVNTHFQDLAKLYPEIWFLVSLNREGLLPKAFYETWKKIVAPQEMDEQYQKELVNKKFAVKTESRQNEMANRGYENGFDKNSTEVQKALLGRLEKLEKHLLLDRNHEEFYIFDKPNFKKYQSLVQIGFETILDKKLVLSERSKLAELSKERKAAVPMKLSRMTANKPNGKSAIIYEFDLENKKYINTPNILIYPANLNLDEGLEIKITDDLDIVKKELSRPESNRKYFQVFVGFLNGNADNLADENQINLIKSDGTSGKRTEFGQRTLKDTRFDDIKVLDDLRPAGEVKAGTNPAGYPKLYYFLIPKKCNNLIIPVKTHSYYLTKYTPYSKLGRYLKLELELQEIREKLNKDEKNIEFRAELEIKAKEILGLRCQLRAYYRLSSIELDLIRTYNFKPDKANQTALIDKGVKAKVHLQIQNPERNYKSEYTYTKGFEADLELRKKALKKYEYVLSVDLGEKILAACSLVKMNWDKFDFSNPKIDKKDQKAIFFLPLNQNFEYKTSRDGDWEKTDLGNKHQEKMGAFTKLCNLLENVNYLEINSGSDKNFDKYMAKVDSYHKMQKTRGVVSEKMKNSRKNLTDQLAQQTATQIAVLAKQKNALVIFENLTVGFGRQVETVKIYTEVRRLVAKKLGKLGMLDLSSVKGDADLDDLRLRHGNLDKVVAANTSKACSDCGYIPRWFIKAKKKGEEDRNGIKILDDAWATHGILEYEFENRVFFRLHLPEKDFSTWKITKFLKSGVERDAKPTFESNYTFTKNKTSNVQKLWSEKIQSLLFKEKEPGRTDSKAKLDSFHKFARNTFLNTRNSQESFECPNCGHKDNADYQAAWNIGVKFLS